MATQFPDRVKTATLLTMSAPYNPREILDHDFAQLKDSLKTFGLVQPIVVNKRREQLGWSPDSKPVIVGGHQRVKAAADPEVGLEELPVYWVDLNEVLERQLNLRLNRTMGDWDEDMLERALRELEELGGGEALDHTGFTEDELAVYLGNPDGSIPGLKDFDEPSDETNRECPKCRFKWKE